MLAITASTCVLRKEGDPKPKVLVIGSNAAVAPTNRISPLMATTSLGDESTDWENSKMKTKS